MGGPGSVCPAPHPGREVCWKPPGSPEARSSSRKDTSAFLEPARALCVPVMRDGAAFQLMPTPPSWGPTHRSKPPAPSRHIQAEARIRLWDQEGVRHCLFAGCPRSLGLLSGGVGRGLRLLIWLLTADPAEAHPPARPPRFWWVLFSTRSDTQHFPSDLGRTQHEAGLTLRSPAPGG